MPRFSIITITYNSSKTLQRTIDSVLAQTYQDFEYIIIDGKSKDNTVSIIRESEKSFKGRLFWKSELDKGIYDAMNKGIKIANGIIVGIVNSDDWLEENALELVSMAYDSVPENERNDTLYCGAITFHYKKNNQIFPVSEKLFYRNIKVMNLKGVWHPGTFIPKKIYDELGLYDLKFRLMGDVDYIYRCYNNNKHFKLIESNLSNMSDGGASSQDFFYVDDQRFIIKKHIKSRIKGEIIFAIWFIKAVMKYIMPSSVLRVIRGLLNKL